MTTLEELVYYCNEPEPISALMLTGEWGCGRTYLLEHSLKDELLDTHIILRISLFGHSSIESIDECVRNIWMNAYLEDKGWNEKNKTVKKWQDKLSRLPLSEDWKNIVSFNPATLFDVANELNDKKVVLVFDDLERCNLNTIDVFGCINDYCENKKFYTIVVANEDKMQCGQQKAESKMNVDNTKQQMTILMDCPHQQSATETISYDEIKEKIIERTIKYNPDYKAIVHAIIENMVCSTNEYHKFLKQYEENILTLFATESNVTTNDENAVSDESKYLSVSKDRRPHNIRSLKCVLQDFYRVYKVLVDNEFSDLDRWLCSFASYMLAYKAGIAREDHYGTLLTDKEVSAVYPIFNDSRFIFKTAKNWILKGEWDIALLKVEIKMIKEREKAVEPKDTVRTNHILDVDEDVLIQGFPDVLEMAYKGELSLYEYVIFIMNCYWARTYQFKLPCIVDWNKAQHGVQSRISMLTEQQAEEQDMRSSISYDNSFLQEEWTTYELIDNFWNKNILMFRKNRQLYMESIRQNPTAAFINCENKRFNVFDEEMATATAEAFSQCDNSEKCRFGGYFKGMWQHYKSLSDIRIVDTVNGFNKLLELLQEEKKSLQELQKMIAFRHTDTFIKVVEELIQVTKID